MDTIIVYAIILASLILIPTVFDILMAYCSRNKNWRMLLSQAAQNGLDKEELQALIKATADSPPGISGMSRSLMAFAVIVILGIAVFHLLGNCQNGTYAETIKNVLSMLAATLASITGFYFGGKSAEEKKGPAPPSRTAAGGGGAAAGGGAAGGAST